MTLTELIDRIKQQLRLTPLVTDEDLISWLQQAIRTVGHKSQFLDKWVIIVCKSGVDKYLLPENHQATTALYYDGVKLQTCTSFDAQLVSVVTPVYYHEDEWEDQASDAVAGEFVTQIGANELWPLQLMRGQDAHGRKTLTMVSAPTADGDATPGGMAMFGTLSGTITADTIFYPDTYGVVYYAATIEGNLLLFCKMHDTLPGEVTEPLEYNDAIGVLYVAQTASLAMGTEDDEYDRYRAWLYDFISGSMTGLLRSMSINVRLR